MTQVEDFGTFVQICVLLCAFYFMWKMNKEWVAPLREKEIATRDLTKQEASK